ncbi:MAG: hypothetical protein VX918_10255 [Chloroflexota bacterium]|nr:hypothetical protein [Chloroflexota bacterium]
MSFTTVSQPQTRLGGVAVPSENASRLIADVQLDDGSPLEPGVVGSDFGPLQTPKFLLHSVNLRLCENHGRLAETGDILSFSRFAPFLGRLQQWS